MRIILFQPWNFHEHLLKDEKLHQVDREENAHDLALT
jgi:hypothetical protein